jgi:hypothetical protein
MSASKAETQDRSAIKPSSGGRCCQHRPFAISKAYDGHRRIASGFPPLPILQRLGELSAKPLI